MIVAPPGEPTASSGRPPRSRIVGAIELRGRLPGAGRFGSGAVPWVGVKLKSVSSLLSRNPRPGTTIALPPICSIVNVYSTTLPHRSTTVRFVVLCSVEPAAVADPGGQLPDRSSGPGATGLGSAFVGSVR